jgi:hypothetical protein
MPQVYTINITMTPETVMVLSRNGFVLYGFKAVKTTNQGAAPLVWLRTRSVFQNTQVTWTDQYRAYLSTSPIVPNGTVAVSSAIAIDLGQTAVVGENGHLTAIAQGTPSAISLSSASFQQWTSGIAQPGADQQPSPLVALPLSGNGIEVIAPVEKVLLLFAQTTFSAGTVSYKAYAPGILVDLTGASQRDVSYDINNGWNWGGGAWATPVAAQQDLIPILVNPGS